MGIFNHLGHPLHNMGHFYVSMMSISTTLSSRFHSGGSSQSIIYSWSQNCCQKRWYSRGKIIKRVYTSAGGKGLIVFLEQMEELIVQLEDFDKYYKNWYCLKSYWKSLSQSLLHISGPFCKINNWNRFCTGT